MNRNMLVACGLTLSIFAAATARGQAIDPVGQPNPLIVKKVGGAKYLVWHENESWHLVSGRAARGDTITLVGTVDVDGDRVIGNFVGKSGKTAQREGVVVYPDGRGFVFQLVPGGGAGETIDFQVGPNAKTVTFKLLINGAELPQRILIGKKCARPDKVTFTLPARPAGP